MLPCTMWERIPKTSRRKLWYKTMGWSVFGRCGEINWWRKPRNQMTWSSRLEVKATASSLRRHRRRQRDCQASAHYCANAIPQLFLSKAVLVLLSVSLYLAKSSLHLVACYPCGRSCLGLKSTDFVIFAVVLPTQMSCSPLFCVVYFTKSSSLLWLLIHLIVLLSLCYYWHNAFNASLYF